MRHEENEPRTGFDPEFNPYAPPRAPLGPEPGRLRSHSSPGGGPPISITHDLIDGDLRRFVDCDAFYDPKPLFGLIPQWVWLIPITATIGFVAGMSQSHWRLTRWAIVSAPILSVSVLVVMVLMAKGRRDAARLAGLCEKRTLTITPGGLTLTIPGIRTVPKELEALGPVDHPWDDFRRIEAMEDCIIFWRKGRSRLVLPRRVFPSPSEADAFVQAATCWHADAA